MNPIQCMQKAASRSDVVIPSQSNRDENKLLLDRPIDVNGLCLQRISKLITDEKWRELGLLLRSADDSTALEEIGIAYHDDVATKLHIGEYIPIASPF